LQYLSIEKQYINKNKSEQNKIVKKNKKMYIYANLEYKLKFFD